MIHKVLVVDDGNERITALITGLSDAGYEVIVVQNSNLPALQEHIRTHQPDFLMLDEDNVIDLSNKEFDITNIAA
ncbi:MAG: hypothetical protein OEZ43_00530 [Gammaproteobacteria bacterium]|nr:hypothetical protein [Gammaproteobacteria bacterium]